MASRIEEISKTLAADKINVFSDNTSFVMQNYDNKSEQDENIFLKGI
jgi:peroxiredoxin